MNYKKIISNVLIAALFLNTCNLWIYWKQDEIIINVGWESEDVWWSGNNYWNINLNIDTNWDWVCDSNCDTDWDWVADLNIDTDWDWVVDSNIDTDWDWVVDSNIDTDWDWVADSNIDTDNDWQTTNMESQACPVDLVSKYEELLLKSNINYKIWTWLTIKSSDDLELMFQTWSDISNHTLIKNNEYNSLISNLWISKDLFMSDIKQDVTDQDFNNKYITKSPTVDFLLHYTYFKKQDWSLQKFVLEKMEDKISTSYSTDLETMSWIIANLKWDIEIVDSLDISEDEKNNIKETASDLIFKPYVDFLAKERKKIFKKIVPECYNVQDLDYWEDVLCWIWVKRVRTWKWWSFDWVVLWAVWWAAWYLAAWSQLAIEVAAWIEWWAIIWTAIWWPVWIAAWLLAVWLMWWFKKPKRKEWNVYSATQSAVENMIELEKIDFYSFVFSNIWNYSDTSADDDVVKDFTWSLVLTYSKLINNNLKNVINDNDEDLIFTHSDRDRICWELSISECRKSLLKSFIDQNIPMWLNKSTMTMLDVSGIGDKINVDELINVIKTKYDKVLLNKAFYDLYHNEFWNENITYTNLNENSEITEDSEAEYPQWFTELFWSWASCDDIAWISDKIQSFIDTSIWDFDKSDIDDFLKDSWITWCTWNSICTEDIDLDSINDFIKNNSWWTVEITMTAPKLNPNITSWWWWSCPFLFQKKWDEIVFMWPFMIEKIFEFLKWNSYQKILSSKNSDNKTEINISSIIPDTIILDQVKLFAVNKKELKKWEDVDIFSDGKIRKFSKIKNRIWLEKNKWEVYLWKFDKEKIVEFNWWIDKKSIVFKVASWLWIFWLYYQLLPQSKMISDLWDLFLDWKKEWFLWRKIFNLIQKFYWIKFQYLDWKEWKTFEEINTYNKKNNIFIWKKYLWKEVRIKYSSNLNKIFNFYKKDFISDIKNSEKFSAKNKNFKIQEKLEKIDDNNVKINWLENLNLIFDTENFNEKEYDFFLKVNWFYYIFEPFK